MRRIISASFPPAILACLLGCTTPLDQRPFFKVQFRENTGWIWGATSYITEDGGKNWRSLSVGYTQEPDYDPGEIRGRVDFASPRVGFHAFRDGLQKSLDGGRTWNKIHSVRFSVVVFCSEDVGIAWRDNISLTHDGGETWTELGAAQSAWPSCGPSEGEFYYAAGRGVYRLTEGREAVLVKEFADLVWGVKPIGDELWIVGRNGLCASYHPVADRWEDYSLPWDDSLDDIGVRGDTLIAVGPKGRLFHRLRGEDQWRIVYFDERDSNLSSVDFGPDGTIYAVGGRPATAWLWETPGSRLVLTSRDGLHWRKSPEFDRRGQ